jgi:hypothetical protein
MSDSQDDLKDEQGNPVLDKNIREHMRKLERENAEVKAKAQAAELKSVYLELGIPNEGAAKLFRDTYSGEPTVEAVRAAASQYGDAVLKTSAPSAADLERQANLDALSRINSSTDAGGDRDAQDILETTLQKLRAAVAKGGDLGKAEYDEIMASPEVQALRNQPISFM